MWTSWRRHPSLLATILLLAGLSAPQAGCGRTDTSGEAAATDRQWLLPPPPPPDNPSAAARAMNEELRLLDPAADGFDTELVNAAADQVLHKLGELLAVGATADELKPYVTESFVGSELRPARLELTRKVRGLEFRRGETAPDSVHGRQGLAAALEALGRPYEGGDVHTKFKIDGLDVDSDEEVSTRILYLAMGHGAGSEVQQNARWIARWILTEDRERLLLRALEVTDFEESRAPGSVYNDVTRSLFASTDQVDWISRGIDGWWGRIDVGLGFSFYGDYGLVLGDVDNDGLDDVYFCQPGGVPNRLFRHNADGTLTDISAGSGVNLLNDTPTALFADLDNDGNQDLVVASLLHIVVMRGDGRGAFEPAGEILVDNAVSLSSADYDADGYLDLYVTRYSNSRSTPSGASIYDSNDGRPNVLLRNEAGFRFKDTTLDSGIDDNNRRFSFAGVWEDYDNDGDQDLYVANDFGRNNLYLNEGGRFTDVAGRANAEDSAAGMGATWADYNQDGLMDLYVSNMFSSAGGRIVDKEKIASLAGEDAVSPLMRFAKGNTLLENRGDGTFRDVSVDAGVTMGRWSWGGEFVDFDNDSRPDLVVPNGFITNNDSKDL